MAAQVFQLAADSDSGLPALLTLQPMPKIAAVLAVLPVGNVPQVMNAVIAWVAVDVVDLVNGPCAGAPGINSPAVARLNAFPLPGQMNAPATLRQPLYQ